MVRRMLVCLVTLVTALTAFAVAGPRAEASFYIGPVNVGCDSVAFPAAVLFNRNNTGQNRENVQIIVTDKTGLKLVNQVVSSPLGLLNAGLGTYVYGAAPTGNPITVQVVSLAGNKLPAHIDLSVQGSCNAIPGAFVRAIYRDLLGREPSPTELDFEVAQIRVNGGRLGVATRLSRSSEYLGRLVNQLYVDTLGRSGDTGGIGYWVDQIQQGRRTLSLVTASFYASNEYFRRHGGTNEGWVRDLYVKFLQRTPDDFGVSYWSSRAGRTRTPVALSFFQSAESKRARISALYQSLFGRPPTASDLQYWVAVLQTGNDLDLTVAITSSPEYAIKATEGR